MAKLKLKKGDLVQVISGEDKGSQGKVLTIDPAKNKALVEGLNKAKRHTKPNAKSPQGGIVEKEAFIHVSNLKLVDASGKATRVGKKRDDKTNKLVRYSKTTQEVIK